MQLPNSNQAEWDKLSTKLQSISTWKDLAQHLTDRTGDTELKTLNHFLSTDASAEVEKPFLANTVNWALKLPELFPTGTVPQVDATNLSVSLSFDEVMCLLSHQILCTLPRVAQKVNYNTSSFQSWWMWSKEDETSLNPSTAYLQTITQLLAANGGSKFGPCTVSYYNFTAASDGDHNNRVTALLDANNAKENKQLCQVKIQQQGAIGDQSEDIEMIFANENIGFGPGGTQEEIMFGVRPHMCVVPLLCRKVLPLAPTASVCAVGFPVVAKYTGYGKSLGFGGTLLKDENPVTRSSNLVSWMDAVNMNDAILPSWPVTSGIPSEAWVISKQCEVELAAREVVKATVCWKQAAELGRKVAGTGHWGCGAFGGDVHVKAATQLIAATLGGLQGLEYYTFGRKEFSENFEQFMALLNEKKPTVGQLWSWLLDYKQFTAKELQDNKDKMTEDFQLTNFFAFVGTELGA
eukprot:TRINITY_DN63778_c0_g1_i1.p2 TRINITY_DN63778_c0_g1~~TRINITY_DN63778_c0_g1_i1.p2  ORF type:complete len:464 (-),score=73.91 TRINITY_DN63778_c0_g1_i1:1850-3241(-)